MALPIVSLMFKRATLILILTLLSDLTLIDGLTCDNSLFDVAWRSHAGLVPLLTSVSDRSAIVGVVAGVLIHVIRSRELK